MAQLKTKFLLFGRTGSGKSTLANMLINGNLDPPLLFGTSSGIRGKTLDMQREESESRIVVDTVGFGEDEGGSVSDEEARNRHYNNFVKLSEGYHYFVYVHKWGKTDYLDTNLWSFCKEAFQGAEDNFLVVFTHSKPGYIEQHREDLRSTFVCCDDGGLEPPNLSSTEVEGPRQVDLLCSTALDGGGLGDTEVLDAPYPIHDG